MPLVMNNDARDLIALPELVERLEAMRIDLTSADCAAECGHLLARLARDGDFLGDMMIDDLKAGFAGQVAQNRYSAQVFLLHRSGRRFFLRANMWPAATDYAYQASGPATFAYDYPHDHNFSFLTVGYFGPGYVSDYYERGDEDADFAGHIGAPIPIRFVETSALETGKLMLYRAHRDIHRQLPPASMSVSLNIMEEGDHVPWRDQYVIDLDKGVIVDTPTLAPAEAIMRCAVHLCGANGVDLAADFARSHPVPRMRANAIAALAAVAEGDAARTAVLERGASDADARVAGESRRRLAMMG
jgi:hypothetical protein